MFYVWCRLVKNIPQKNKSYPVGIPKVSIITVVYNGFESLRNTIISITNQTYPNIEYIIIDGGSGDGTIELIREYSDDIDFWVSEKDEGISDAMNKGLKMSSGEYVIYMNCGDYFLNSESLSEAMSEIRGYEILLCRLIYGANNIILRPRGFNFWMNFKTGALHQAAIVHREVFNKIGDFDLQFKIALDYDFFLRAYLQKIRVKKTNIVLSYMDDLGISSRKDIDSILFRLNEERKIHIKNSHSIFMHITYRVYWLFYLLYKRWI